MIDEQFRRSMEMLRHHIATFQQELPPAASGETIAALEALQLVYEEMQTNLEAARVVEEGLFQEVQRITASRQHYYELFDSAPIPYLLTNASGVILEANRAIAQLLNVSPRYLVGKPLAVFIAPDARPAFRTRLNQLFRANDPQIWWTELCPRDGEPLAVELHLAIVYSASSWIEALRIGVYDLSRLQQTAAPQRPVGTLPLSLSLDGLRVLVVDDEADAREVVTAILESHGIEVTAVATAHAALEVIEQFLPDVLISDIRMPVENGYSFIRRVRELEVRQGRRHIPAAAFTAYLEESREKALSAGFEAHLHKLARPDELVALVAQLAGRSASAEPGP